MVKWKLTSSLAPPKQGLAVGDEAGVIAAGVTGSEEVVDDDDDLARCR